MNKSRGFTLIELLVVIAIIGILSAVVLTSLNSARSKAKAAAALATLRGVQPSATLCVDAGASLSTATTSNAICAGVSGMSNWPALPANWAYGTASSTPAAGIYEYSATGDSVTVTCDESACTQS